MKKILRSRCGATLVFSVFAITTLVMLAGFAIDVGQLYVARRHAQRVCDSAALAGAGAILNSYSDLTLMRDSPETVKTSAATNVDSVITRSNSTLMPNWKVEPFGVGGSSTSTGRYGAGYTFFGEATEGLTLPDLSPWDIDSVAYQRFNNAIVNVPTSPISAVEVKGQTRVNFSLTRVMGFKTGYTPVRSIAIVGAATSLKTPFLPWAVSADSFGQKWPGGLGGGGFAQPDAISTFYLIDHWDVNTPLPTNPPPSFVTLSFQAYNAGTNDYQKVLVQGSAPTSVLVGDYLPVDSLAGNKDSKTWEALEARINGVSTSGSIKDGDIRSDISPTRYGKEVTPKQNDEYGGPSEAGATLPEWLNPTSTKWYGRGRPDGPAMRNYWKWKNQDGLPEDGRSGLVPVTAGQPVDRNGRQEVQVKGFAQVYITNFYFVQFDANGNIVDYKLTKQPGQGWVIAVDVIFVANVELKDAIITPGAPGFGVYGIALVR